MAKQEINAAKKTMSRILRKKLKTRGESLDAQLKKAKGKLPKGARRDAYVILKSEKDLAHPILRKRVDPSTLRAAKRRFIRRTGAIDLDRDRVRGRYYLALDIVIKLFVTCALLFGAIAYFT
jgi:hypothetical protein